jgi:hypothetical protein
MQADLWKVLLRRIPPEHVDNLVLMTAQGTEINVQALLCMEGDWMVLRGRIAGSNDGGRTFILPYEHLDHAGFQRPLSEAQLQAIFDVTPAAAVKLPGPAETTVADAPPPAAPAPDSPASPAPRLLARVPSRSKMIERLRMRAEARDGANSPPKE